MENIAAKGARYSLVYEYVLRVLCPSTIYSSNAFSNGVGLGGISASDFITAMISAQDGQYLVGQFAAGKTVNISFPQAGASFELTSDTGGLMSGFSTYGPTNDLFL